MVSQGKLVVISFFINYYNSGCQGKINKACFILSFSFNIYVLFYFSFISVHLKEHWAKECLSLSLSQMNEGVSVVSLPEGQTLQMQGVIQTTQPSVIQSPQIQTVQVHTCRVYIYI